MRRLLVVNPNTSASVSERLHEHVAAIAGTEVQVRAATASFGASYISDEISFAIAAHAALDAVAADREQHGDVDAVLLACFGDPGIEALRDLTGRPVVGLAEAAMRQAAGFGRFAVVTGGAAWKPMLERIARSLGWGEALTRVTVVAASGDELAADPDAAVALLQNVCREAAVGADAVILGGAGLAGLAGRIAPALDVPLIDSVGAGALAAVAAARSGVARARRGAGVSTRIEWRGLSTPLLHRLT
jgi:Asp/Glu/hydantoin racemase